MDEKAIARFWGKVEKSDGCWLWLACKNKLGYGSFRFGGKPMLAHRVSAIIAGLSVSGVLVCHRCDNPGCVRPDHLFLGSPQDNVDDMYEKGRQDHSKKSRGDEHPMRKLNAAQATRIRELCDSGANQRAIGREYGVSWSTVNDIARRRTWL